MTVCTSVNNASWKGCGHFFKLADAAAEHFSNCSSADALFLAMYARLCWDFYKGFGMFV